MYNSVTKDMVKVEVGRKVCADTDRLSWAQDSLSVQCDWLLHAY